jgi:hypothetical protein
MAKNTEQKKASDQETISNQEIWPAIRYLDPDAEKDTTGIALVITLVGLVCIVCIVCLLFYLRGL